MMAWGVIWLWIWGGESGLHSLSLERRLVVHFHPRPRHTYMDRDVDVVAVPRVDIYCVEASAGAIDDLEPLSLLYCQVYQQRAVRQVSKGLWRREGVRGHRRRSQTLQQGRGAEAGITLKAMNLW